MHSTTTAPQAAEGLHFGIVPYVSRPALGIVSGMVSAGGNLGAVMLLGSFFEDGARRVCAWSMGTEHGHGAWLVHSMHMHMTCA